MAKQKPVQSNDKKEKSRGGLRLPNVGIGTFADEIAKMVVARLPGMMQGKRKKKTKTVKKIENAFFLDTSAIIDSRVFDVIKVGLVGGIIVIPESILLELKHIADSTDMVKRERGRRGLESLERLKKTKDVKVVILSSYEEKQQKKVSGEVDEILIKITKQHRGRIITCDYNLEKKARIEGVIAVNMNALANMLKITAVPGESLHVKILHSGKDNSQGVGYLDDGTMIVVEEGSVDIGKEINIVISRVIQTDAGRILFAKKI